MSSNTCPAPDCIQPKIGLKGWCRRHNEAMTRNGTLERQPTGRKKSAVPCAVPDCENNARKRTVCQGHYGQWRKGLLEIPGQPAPDLAECDVPGCANDLWAKGYCNGHYLRWQNNGDPGPAQLQEKVARPDECVVDGCTDKVQARLMCHRHYQVAREGGELKAKRPQAPAGSGWITAEGYHYFKKDGVTYAKHRVVMEQHLGRTLFPWETVDHLTGGPKGRSDNRIENLRLMVGKHPRGHDPENVVSYGRQMLALYGSPDERERYASLLPEITNDSDVTVALESARAYAKAKAGERPATPTEEPA